MLVVGNKEQEAGTVNVRARDTADVEAGPGGDAIVQGVWELGALVERLQEDVAAFK